MAGNWNERDRDEQDMRRADYEGRWPERGERQYQQSEGRSFRTDGRPQGDSGYKGGQDRVFGERETGASYGGPSSTGRGSGAGGNWQDRHYGGVSPAMRQGEYEAQPRFSRQDYRAGGRFYGDDNRERIYREEYGMGGGEYRGASTGYDAGGYSPTRARYHADGYGQPGYDADYRRDMNRPASGGTGGYDYERGYGDGGRGDSRGERFERAGRGAGDFLHRAGERVASWFNGGDEGRIDDPNYLDPNRSATRGARGLGPQGYKRSDERINEEAHERLTDDTWLDASNIGISVSGGEVTLSGTVESREAKHRSERLVEDLSGVNHVQNNLRIERGNPLTHAGSGYGDSVLGEQLRRDEPATNGSGGAGAGQSTAGRKT
jgi:osmotically-inducible protein OsmY